MITVEQTPEEKAKYRYFCAIVSVMQAQWEAIKEDISLAGGADAEPVQGIEPC